MAVDRGSADMVRALLFPSGPWSPCGPQLFSAAEFSANAADKKGKTPLHLCSKENNEEILSLLLSRGAKPSEMDSDGFSLFLSSLMSLLCLLFFLSFFNLHLFIGLTIVGVLCSGDQKEMLTVLREKICTNCFLHFL
jgi:hypothetical protein